MPEDETSTVIAVLFIISIGGLIGFYTGVLSFYAILVGVIFLGCAYVVWSLWKSKMMERMKEAVDHRGRDTLSEGKDLDDIWNDLQEWLGEKPREMEIVWTRQHSNIQTLPAKSLDDEVYVFTSIVTKLDGVDDKVHICVENTTGCIVAFREVTFEEQVKRDPFQYISFVQELRRHQFSSDEIVDAMRRNSAGQLPGGYMRGMPVDNSMTPEVSNDSEQPTDTAD